jgi:SAM-dependent methyltransferase
MDPLGKKELLSFYNRHLKDFGDAPQAVRWTPEGQLRRYENLLKMAGYFSGKTVLDFGCGKGDFYGFLHKKESFFNYCGIDINENLISLARSKYPEAEFLALDIEEETFQRTFDLILVCGVFNLRVAGIEETMKNIVKKLFGLCAEALHLNLLSYYIPRRNIELFYVKPEELLQFAVTELSPQVTLMNTREDVYLSVYREAIY